VATIVADEGEGALESRPLISEVFGGRRIALQPDASGVLPLLFTASGKFVSVIGAEGSGPGEFRSPYRVLVTGDSAIVFDAVLGRATTIGPSGAVGGTIPWRATPLDAVVLSDGSFALASPAGSRRALAQATKTGEVVREFGDSLPRMFNRWHLAASGSRFWSAPSLYQLRFEEWRAPDSLVRVVEPVTSHFVPYDRYLLATEDRPYPPALRGFWLDSLSRIWALIEVPGAEWRSGLGPPRRGEDGQMVRQIVDANRAYASVVLVIDPSTGEILAERTIDGWFYEVVEPFVIMRAQQNNDGWYRAELWRVAMRQ
jgi:hypothetical protein